MRRPNHASRFEGIAKTNLQASRASDTETLQSQVNKAAKKRLSLSGLEILHGRLSGSRAHPCRCRLFRVYDITKDEFDPADVWLCKDCIQHLSNRDIMLATSAIH